MSQKAPMLKNNRNHDAAYSGCSCCNTPAQRRKGIHASKRKEERAWRKELSE